MWRSFIFIILSIIIFHPLYAQYQGEIMAWRQNRLQALVAEEGWATLAGLFPLKEGKQFIGSKTDELRFPDFAPDTLGMVEVIDSSVIFYPYSDEAILVNGQRVGQTKLWPAQQESTICEYGRLQWFIIERGDRFLLRLRDTEHPARKKLQTIPYFPIDKSWRLQATFHPYSSPRVIPLPNALDMIIDGKSSGYLSFSMNDREYSLVTLDGGPDQLFILFYDLTSGHETYGGGRYMYVEKPDASRTTIIDFNKAYSPPCAFTPFATCLLPPKENRLELEIKAGEKDPHFLAQH